MSRIIECEEHKLTMILFLLQPAAQVDAIGLEGLPVDESISTSRWASHRRLASITSWRRRFLVTVASIGRSGDTKTVRNGVLVCAAGDALVSGLRSSPSLSKEVTVLSESNVITRQNIGVEVAALLCTCFGMVDVLSIAGGSTESSVKRRACKDLRGDESALSVAVLRSVDGGSSVIR